MWSVIWVSAIVAGVFGGLENEFINFGGFSCPREENALGACLRDALNAYIPRLSTGVPEFGVPSCEPLIVPSLSVQQSAGPISVTSSYSDVTVHGPSTMRVVDLKVDAKNQKVEANIHIPELRMNGNYRISGKLVMLPIEGAGKFSGKYADINAKVTITLGRQHHANAVDSLSCEHLTVKFHVGDASMNLENLFGDDKEFGAAINKYLNENWQRLAEELQAPMEDALQDFLKPLADHAFATLNADDILVP